MYNTSVARILRLPKIGSVSMINANPHSNQMISVKQVELRIWGSTLSLFLLRESHSNPVKFMKKKPMYIAYQLNMIEFREKDSMSS